MYNLMDSIGTEYSYEEGVGICDKNGVRLIAHKWPNT